MTPDQERDRLSRGIPPQWASAWGEDEFGVFACFEVGGVEVRLRWIEGGKFMMGSPVGEVGRSARERLQHEEEMTSGFWLADTPCPQELWMAVMRNNPSPYQSPRRPIDQMSWEEVQLFFERLNARVEGLEAGLPSETQWEHACRAGTVTATYAGDLTHEIDDPVLQDIAWYLGNSRDGAKDVGRKRPNSWGLYDMLGNVHEWCAEPVRDPKSKAPQDPTVANHPAHVFRGGGWDSSSQDVRAAGRYWLGPGFRGNIGFRLCRGQVLRSAQTASQ